MSRIRAWLKRCRELAGVALESRRRSRTLAVLAWRYPGGIPDHALREAGLCDLAAGGHFYEEAIIRRVPAVEHPTFQDVLRSEISSPPTSPYEIIKGWRCACGATSGRRGTDAELRRAFDPLENARAAARFEAPQVYRDGDQDPIG